LISTEGTGTIVHDEERNAKPKRLLEARSGGDGDAACRVFPNGTSEHGNARVDGKGNGW
jgi:hypothetical protein